MGGHVFVLFRNGCCEVVFVQEVGYFDDGGVVRFSHQEREGIVHAEAGFSCIVGHSVESCGHDDGAPQSFCFFPAESGRLQPHHGAEIPLGRFVTVVVSSRFEQAVREYDVCITKEGRRAVFASCDVPQFVFVGFLVSVGYGQMAAGEQLICYGEERGGVFRFVLYGFLAAQVQAFGV